MRVFKVIFFLLLSLLCIKVEAQYDRVKHEYRAVWLTTIENLDWPKTQVRVPSDTLRQQQELVEMLDSLKALNVNTVLLQTRVRGDVIYPSEIEPFSHVLTGRYGGNPGYDALAFAIEECHKRDMQLHAWIVTLPLGKLKHVKELGRLSMRYSAPELCRFFNGSWYMEPGEPRTARYLSRLVGEIVNKYDVDGIHLDYVRYPDRPKNYPDRELYRKYGGGLSLDDWRRQNITNIVTAIYNTVKSVKPWVRVSCAPLGKYDDVSRYSSLGWNARNTVFQEAQEWVADGVMDVLFPMLYFNGNNFYPFVFDWQENSNGRHIVPGLGIYRLLSSEGNWSPLEIKRQLYNSRYAGTAGTAMFRARHLLQNIKGGTDIYRLTYPYPSFVPAMNWVDEPILPAPFLYASYRGKDRISLRWHSVKVPENYPAPKYRIYAADSDTIDTSDMRNYIASTSDTTFVWSGGNTLYKNWAIVAVDAYGRESAPALWCDRKNVNGLFRNQISLPDAQGAGQYIVIRNAEGRAVYRCDYRRVVGVRGVPKGYYVLEVYSSDGGLIQRYPFTR